MSEDLALRGERHADELETRVSGVCYLRIFEVQGTLPFMYLQLIAKAT
jgi:hypothetical protein